MGRRDADAAERPALQRRGAAGGRVAHSGPGSERHRVRWKRLLGGGRRIAGVATPLVGCNGEYDTDYSEKDRANSPGIGQQSDSKGRDAGDKEP